MEPREIVKAFERLGFSTDGAEDNAAALIRALAADGWSVCKLERVGEIQRDKIQRECVVPDERYNDPAWVGATVEREFVYRVAAGEAAGEGE